MKKKYRFFSLLAAISLASCNFTNKDVKKTSSLSDNSGGAQVITDTPIVVTSHSDQDRVSTETITLTGTCAIGGADVTVSGNIENAPRTSACVSGLFSIQVKLTQLNTSNTLIVQQGSKSQTLQLKLFVRAAFCGDNIVNQDWEKCDGSADCDDKCQSPSNPHSNIVLAKVTVLGKFSLGNGNVTEDIFVGSNKESIPSGKWFIVYDDGIFFVDQSTDNFKSVPGMVVRRIPNEVKVMLHTELTSSDFEHANGSVSFFNSTINSLKEGTGTEALENATNGEAKLVETEDEIFIESGSGFFWFTEKTENDAFFVKWNTP